MKRVLPFVPGLAVGIVLALSSSAGLFRAQESFFADLLFSPRALRPDIVIVAIDDPSIKAIGQWPWPRAAFADFFSRIAEHPPRAVGLDVLFSERSRSGVADDAALAAALRQAAFPVVMPLEAQPLVVKGGVPSSPNPPLRPLTPFFGENVSAGFANLILDPDGVARTMPLAVNDPDGHAVGAFATLIADNEKEHAPAVRSIVFAGAPGTVPRISFSDVLDGSVPPEALEGKYVFVGATAPDLHDEQLTPVSRGTPMSGVEIQAQTVNMLLSGYRLDPLSDAAVALWVLLAALMPAVVFRFTARTRRALVISLVLGILTVPALIALFEAGKTANIVHANLAWVLGTAAAFGFRHFVVEREKRELRTVFSKYVSRDVLDDILRNPAAVKLGGDERQATVFFSDVRAFTTLSERLTPSALTQFLNRYFTLMTNIVLEGRGVVDKYIGDAVMAFWGAPLANADHARDAALAALAMIDALHDFNERNVASGGQAIDIGIGFNSGSVIAGNMGSDQRFDYTVMGDTVNLAARLEGQTKTYGIHIITSEFTAALLPSAVREAHGIMLREIDRVRVKGKKLPVTIYEVVERSRVEQVRKSIAAFDALRAAYYEGAWERCVALGKEILAADPSDGPAKVLSERAEHFREEPPAAWEGVYDFKTK